DVLDGVGSLLSKSLLQQREGVDGEPRFVMLETIQEYARDKLAESGEADALEREHALYFMALAEEAEPHLTGARQAEWLAGLEEEPDNLRAALRWAREGRADSGLGTGGKSEIEPAPVEVGLRIAGALLLLWLVRGYYSEGREHLAGMLALSPKHAPPTN